MREKLYFTSFQTNRICSFCFMLSTCFIAVQNSAQAQTQVEVQQALNDARKGDVNAASLLKDRYGDRVLRNFSEARFDKDPSLRMATLEIAGESFDSIVFILPLIGDENIGIASGAIRKLTRIAYYGRESFDKLRAEQVIPPIAVALKKHPELASEDSLLLLFLAQYKNNPDARSLLGRLLKANKWDGFFVGNTPVKWDRRTIAALLTQCEMGRLNPAQVQTVFDADPRARLILLDYIDYLNNKSMLRYALSLLYDKTQITSGMNDVVSPIVRQQAWTAFCYSTKIGLKVNQEGGSRIYEITAPQFDPETIAKFYAYFGLTKK